MTRMDEVEAKLHAMYKRLTPKDKALMREALATLDELDKRETETDT